MDFETAVSEIKKIYKINQVTTDVYKIETDVILSSYENLVLALKQDNDKLFLNDYAQVANALDLEEENMKDICNEFEINLENYHLTKEYTKKQDLISFVNAVIKIKKNI